MEVRFCECGCGVEVKNRYVRGHSMTGKSHTEEWKIQRRNRPKKPPRENPGHLCECGCGDVTNIAPHSIKARGIKIGEPYRFIGGHYRLGQGASWTAEVRARQSIIMTGKKFPNRKSPSTDMWNKGTHESGMKGKHHTEESKRKCSDSNYGLKRTESTKEKLSKISKERWDNPEWREQHIKRILSINIPNKREIWLEKCLNELYPGEWKFVGNGQVIIAGKCPDFININGQKKIIEFWGDHWHQDENPQDRADIFKPFGYETMIIWESELKNMKEVKKRIHNFAEIGRIA